MLIWFLSALAETLYISLYPKRTTQKFLTWMRTRITSELLADADLTQAHPWNKYIFKVPQCFQSTGMETTNLEEPQRLTGRVTNNHTSCPGLKHKAVPIGV
jgi:hypothetical protein